MIIVFLFSEYCSSEYYIKNKIL